MRWLKVGGGAARRALSRVLKSLQHEGRGWLILNVTIVNFFPFFGCRVLKSDRWHGRVFAGISKFIKGCFNHNSLTNFVSMFYFNRIFIKTSVL